MQMRDTAEHIFLGPISLLYTIPAEYENGTVFKFRKKGHRLFNRGRLTGKPIVSTKQQRFLQRSQSAGCAFCVKTGNLSTKRIHHP